MLLSYSQPRHLSAKANSFKAPLLLVKCLQSTRDGGEVVGAESFAVVDYFIRPYLCVRALIQHLLSQQVEQPAIKLLRLLPHALYYRVKLFTVLSEQNRVDPRLAQQQVPFGRNAQSNSAIAVFQ